VQDGVDYLLFNLLVLGSITGREGYVWTRSPTDLYVIETMPLMQRDSSRMAVCFSFVLSCHILLLWWLLSVIAVVIFFDPVRI